MMLRLKISKISIALLCLIFIIALLPAFAFAEDATSQNKISLTVTYLQDNLAAKDVEFRIYRVSNSAYDADIKPTGVFKSYSVDLNCKSSDEWRALAATLAGYVSRDEVTPTDIGKTNAKGEVIFPVNKTDLETGLYLVVGDSNINGDYIYTPEPLMVFLPTKGSYDNDEFDVTVSPKYEKRTVSEKISCSAIKVWENDDKNSRPKEVAVQLLRNGKVYNKAVLNQENNWRFTWSGLDSKADWMVVEMQVPSNYTASVEQNGDTFVITNTYEKTDAVPSTPSTQVTPNLPVTGMLQWPIPVLAAIGVVLFSVGYIKHRKSDNDE